MKTMKKLSEKHIVKIPKNIIVIYSNKKKTLTLIGPLRKKTLKLSVHFFIIQTKNTLQISPFSFFKLSKKKIKKIKIYQGTTSVPFNYLLVYKLKCE